MSGWSDGYVTGIDYTDGFYAGLAPSAQNLALLLRGFTPVPIDEPFTYCELGCGRGFTTVLHAAVNPHGAFWGIDFNPAHIASAEQLTRAAGVTNATFLDVSFVEAAAADLPRFDFIALHGVWSWISGGNRSAIVEFVRARLKPGGVVYISYNALPGWSGQAPLRQLLVESLRNRGEPTLADIEGALAFARRMRDTGAHYFGAQPQAGERLESIAGSSRNYLAHEFFNRDWAPSYFSDVATDLSEAKLTFAGASAISEQIDRLNLSEDMQKLLGEVSDPTARETLRDFALNTRFRRDLFVRGARRLDPRERQERLLATRLALVRQAPSLPVKIRVPVGEVTLGPAPYGAIFDALMEAPLSFADVIGRAEAAGSDAAAVFQAVVVLMAAGAVAPAMSRDADTDRRAAQFNRAVMGGPEDGGREPILASATIGTGIPMPAADRILLEASAWGRNGDADLSDQLGMRLDVALGLGDSASTEERRSARLAYVETFRSSRMPVYRTLGLG